MTTARSRWKLCLRIGVPVFFALGLLYVFGVEPYWVEVTRYEVPLRIQSPVRVAVIADLHSTGFGRRERKTLEILEQEAPDVILIAGDVLSTDGVVDEIGDFLRRLDAPRGVFVVRGNWDNVNDPRDLADFFRSAELTELRNASLALREDLWLVGFDDYLTGYCDRKLAFDEVPPDVATIALFHSPDFIDHISDDCDVAFAGHSHGGQVCLPFLDALFVPPGCGDYVAGWYQKDRARLFVSRGVGMSVIPMRLLCRPEITIVTLTPTE